MKHFIVLVCAVLGILLAGAVGLVVLLICNPFFWLAVIAFVLMSKL